jgi:hypothetical protein
MLGFVLRLVIGFLLIMHGFAHWRITSNWGALATAQSTVLSSIGLTESAIDAFGTALWLVALFVFLAAGAAILFNQEWWRQLAIIGAAVSLLTIALFWQTTMILGALVDVAIVVVLVGSDWPSPALVGA